MSANIIYFPRYDRCTFLRKYWWHSHYRGNTRCYMNLAAEYILASGFSRQHLTISRLVVSYESDFVSLDESPCGRYSRPGYYVGDTYVGPLVVGQDGVTEAYCRVVSPSVVDYMPDLPISYNCDTDEIIAYEDNVDIDLFGVDVDKECGDYANMWRIVYRYFAKYRDGFFGREVYNYFMYVNFAGHGFVQDKPTFYARLASKPFGYYTHQFSGYVEVYSAGSNLLYFLGFTDRSILAYYHSIFERYVPDLPPPYDGLPHYHDEFHFFFDILFRQLGITPDYVSGRLPIYLLYDFFGIPIPDDLPVGYSYFGDYRFVHRTVHDNLWSYLILYLVGDCYDVSFFSVPSEPCWGSSISAGGLKSCYEQIDHINYGD